jgi:nitrite reductase/ring-hydroxylating ferredoxin subunit
MKLLHLEGERLVLARTEQGYLVFNDRCTHRGGSLAGGVIIRGVVQCPWHGSQFDCRSGKVTAGPATEPILTYQAAEQGGNVVLTFGVPERA